MGWLLKWHQKRSQHLIRTFFLVGMLPDPLRYCILTTLASYPGSWCTQALGDSLPTKTLGTRLAYVCTDYSLSHFSLPDPLLFTFTFFLPPLLLFPRGPADLFDLGLNGSRHLQQEFGAFVAKPEPIVTIQSFLRWNRMALVVIETAITKTFTASASGTQSLCCRSHLYHLNFNHIEWRL